MQSQYLCPSEEHKYMYGISILSLIYLRGTFQQITRERSTTQRLGEIVYFFNRLSYLKFVVLIVKVALYSFMTPRALMMRASVICARSDENVGFS